MGIRALFIMLLVAVAAIAAMAFTGDNAIFLPGLLEGALLTIQIAVVGSIIAFCAAILAALGKMYGPLAIRWLANIYIEVFRGTSALVQLFWLFFVLPQFGLLLDAYTSAVIGLGLNVGAYGAEVVRGAIGAVPRGQWEASTALNMTKGQMLRRIILPQALLAMIPPWGNLLIELLKTTALVSMITLTDLAFKAQQLNQTTMKTVPIFTLVLLMYLVISLVITIGMRLLERRASRGLARGRPA
ncbi:MAG: ectoine/hydroxyectoine ABC transporter permease subunit EhuC [Alphaproteobacteria bacterium]|nr:ectoine/hydroxyectoine ABC transporter permease subunit EhuC [Alphaproteobacteria bacterium]